MESLKKSRTALEIARLMRVPGKHRIGSGLYLVVRQTSATWVFRYKFRKRPREMGLGSAHRVTLAEARAKVQEFQVMLTRGEDPAKRHQQKEIPTFQEAAAEFVAARQAGWSSPRHAKIWTRSLENHVFPVIGSRPVNEITTDDVLRVLKTVWVAAPVTATRIRQRMEAVLDAAKVLGYRDGENPARWKGHLDKLLPSPTRIHGVRHFEAMPWTELPVFMATLRASPGIASKAMEFLILTAARTGEVLGATWDEIDLENNLWTIPAGRIKGRRSHQVPLTEAAINVLRKTGRFIGNDHLFPGRKSNRGLSMMALLGLMKRLAGGKYTVHGFRSSFRDWATENAWSVPREAIEMSLGHMVGNATERAYLRTTLLEHRRQLMEKWSRFLQGEPSQVIAFKSRP
jgi:integrase